MVDGVSDGFELEKQATQVQRRVFDDQPHVNVQSWTVMDSDSDAQLVAGEVRVRRAGSGGHSSDRVAFHIDMTAPKRVPRMSQATTVAVPSEDSL